MQSPGSEATALNLHQDYKRSRDWMESEWWPELPSEFGKTFTWNCDGIRVIFEAAAWVVFRTHLARPAIPKMPTKKVSIPRFTVLKIVAGRFCSSTTDLHKRRQNSRGLVTKGVRSAHGVQGSKCGCEKIKLVKCLLVRANSLCE